MFRLARPGSYNYRYDSSWPYVFALEPRHPSSEMDRVLAWCQDQLPNGDGSWAYGFCVIYIRGETHASAFRLRWC